MTQRAPQRPTPRIALAREVAYSVLRGVSEDDAYANLLLPSTIAQAGLSAQDAALATELTYGTLRRRGTYDAVIASAADRAVDDIDIAVLDALRLAVHQLFAMRVPTHAAVNESVSLVTKYAGRGASGFANAVLRRVTKDSPESWQRRLSDGARSDDERLALQYAHPVWIIRAFRRALAAEGRAEELEALLDADNVSPEVTLVALPGLAEAVEPRRPYAPTAFGSPGGDPARQLTQSGGTVRVQDEGSQLVALALRAAQPVNPGERWLDLCAGPGGKTALLAAIANQVGARLEANELIPHRAGLVRQAVAAVPGDVPVAVEDGRVFAERHPQAFDRILVDAPCTGLGALRRRPEARWRKQPSDVPELLAVQEKLLSAAVTALVPGGVVAYVTCSPHLAETTGVLATVREAHPELVLLDAPRVLNEIAQEPLDLGTGELAQLWPHRHGTDAMFLALLRKPKQGE